MLTLEDDFSWIAANAFSDMRLLAEGAIALFEDEADILSRLARDAGKVEAMTAFNDIGTALYAFRSYIKKLQTAQHRVEMQEPIDAQEAEAKTNGFDDSQQEPENR